MPATSPFKFLDAYEKEDKDIFFGRDDEVEQLYNLVFQSNLTLVYGQSGTGKTSLIQCGLANRFAQSDWFNVYIRRNDNISNSLLQSLKRYNVAETGGGTLRERLTRRGQDSEEVIARRLANARAEIAHHGEFDYLIVNDDFQVALAALRSIVLAQRQRTARQKFEYSELVEELLR